jgi:exonuclease SbcC
MIITDISAENILKYRQVELHDLPENGIIAIEGVNESGKSTIGEIICFALFGRTYSLSSGGLEKLIRWDEPRCSVTIRFRIANGHQFEIVRMLDRAGNQGARLGQVGGREPIARGTAAVDDTLCDLLGFGYDEFIESFYLAQREISTPHPHSHAVKTMAGLTHMEYLDYEYAEEIAEQQEAIGGGRSEIGQIEEAIAALAIDPDRLPSLEAEGEVLQKKRAGTQTEVDQLEQASTAYQDTLPEIRAAVRSRGRAKVLRFLSFLFTLALLGGWFLLDRMPDSGYGQMLASTLSEQIPEWGPQYRPWLLYGGVASGILFLMFWFRVAALNGHSTKLLEVSQTLADRLSAMHQDAPTTEGGEMAVESEAAPVDESPAGEEVPVVAGSEEIALASLRIATFQAEAAEVRELVGRALSRLRQEVEQLQQEIGRLEQTIATEKERVDKAASLSRLKEDLEENIAELQQHIHLRELGRELLQGAIGYQSQQFNRELRGLVGHTLPLFTEGRYEHLQIDEDLTVRVFSSDKRDFMDLEEISSGTQRQVMLAVRLALSQELVNSTVEGKQFMFLDEPFAFFDQQRTSNALKVLPDLSDSITQIWIVAQSFPPGQAFDVQILCTREQETLPGGL